MCAKRVCKRGGWWGGRLHGIYSVFVLSDHLWFGSSFPVEFATPVAVAVLGLEPLQFHRP